MIASFVLTAALSAAAANEVTISNFRSGLACTHSTPVSERDGWICQPTDLILVTDQGSCVYDGKSELCTWHGFEFDYSATKPGIKLQCVSHSNQPADDGTPENVKALAATSTSFDLELPERTGHIYNPQYYLFKVRRAGEADLIEETECSYNGTTAFKLRFRFHFPTLPATT